MGPGANFCQKVAQESKLQFNFTLQVKRYGVLHPRLPRNPDLGGNLCRSAPSELGACLTCRLMYVVIVEFWPTRESFGMARGPRFWALGVDSGPRGGAFEGALDPPKNNNK